MKFGVAATVLLSLLAAPGPAQVAPLPDHVFVQGRCVAAEDRAPLAGCEVLVTGLQATGYPLSWGVMRWFDPAPAVTGADGHFRVRVDWPPGRSLGSGYPCRVHVRIHAEDRPGTFDSICMPRLFEDGGRDFGDVPLPRGVRPEVLCVAPDGAPQPGVEVRARLRPDAAQAEASTQRPNARSGPSSFRSGRSDAEGRVRWSAPLQAGEWQLTVHGRSGPDQPHTLTFTAADADAVPITTLTVEALAPAHTMSGTIRGADGAPAAGLPLVLRQGGEWLARGATDADGRFTLVTTTGVDGATAELAMPKNRRYDGWHSFGHREFGDRQVRVTVPATRTLPLSVVDGNGAAIEQFAVLAEPVDIPSTFATPQRISGRFAAGRVDVPQLLPGTWKLTVVPRGRELAAANLSVQVPAAGAEIEPTVLALPPTIAQTWLLRADGQPVAGITVDLLSSAKTIDARAFAYGGPVALSAPARQNHEEPVRFVDRAVSDAEGRVTLRAPAGLDGLCLHVRGPFALPGFRPVDAFREGTGPQPLVVTTPARVCGTIVDVEVIDRLDRTDPKEVEKHRSWGLQQNDWQESVDDLRRRTRPHLFVEADGEVVQDYVPIGDDGRFDTGAIPVGPIVLRLRVPASHEHEEQTFELWRGTLAARRVDAPPLTLPRAARTLPR